MTISSTPTGAAASSDFEYELLDTGVFDQDRYFDVFVEYAKASPEDILIQITVDNRGPEPAELHVLPTLWFRNIWSWSIGGDRPIAATGWRQPRLRGDRGGRSRRWASSSSIARGTARCCSPRTRPTRSGSSGSPTARLT